MMVWDGMKVGLSPVFISIPRTSPTGFRNKISNLAVTGGFPGSVSETSVITVFPFSRSVFTIKS